MDFPLPGSDLVNPLASQFGHLSVQDKAFLDAFSRQEQQGNHNKSVKDKDELVLQELHGVPRPGPVDPTSLLGQLEQITTQRLQRQGSVQSSTGSSGTAGDSSSGKGADAQQRHHEIVEELAPEEVRWFYKREVDKDWTQFMGYDSVRIELRYRHIWQTKWSEADRRSNTLESGSAARARGGSYGQRGRRTRSLSRSYYDGGGGSSRISQASNDYDDDLDYLDDLERTSAYTDEYGPAPGGSIPGYYASTPATAASMRLTGGSGAALRGRQRGQRPYRSTDNFMEDDCREDSMRIIVRGGVYEVDLAEWKCFSIYWPGEAFDILRGTWFHETTWQPLQCEYADKVEQEHLQRFLGHKMADYVWDSNTSTRLEKQVHHTMSFPEFHVDWMSPEEVYLHRENTSSQLYRGISASLGFKKPVGYRLLRGYKELAQYTDRLPDITHIVFVVHGVGQVVDDTTIIRNTNVIRDNVSNIMSKHFPNYLKDSGHRIEFFPVEWRSNLRLDDGMVKHITPQRIMGLRNLLNSSAMDIMYYTSPLFRMEIYHTLQDELNRLYEMFVQRNPYFEANGGKVSIVAHSLGCVVTYDILTGWTQDVEHSWNNLQSRGGGVQDLKRSRRFRPPGGAGAGAGAQSGLLFRIENFFCLGSPLSVFLTLRWKDPTNQEYHDHMLPRSLCKFLYNVYHPCDPVAYRMEPVFMKFYSKVEPIHLYSANEVNKTPYQELPLQPLQNARKEDEVLSDSASALLPVNIANGHINISMSKMLPSQMPSSLSLSKFPGMQGLASATTTSGTNLSNTVTTTSTTASSNSINASGVGGAMNQVGGAMNQVGQAAGGLLGGVMGLVKDAAAAAVHPGASSESAKTTSTISSSRPGMPAVLPSSKAHGSTHSATSLASQANAFTKSIGNVTASVSSAIQQHKANIQQNKQQDLQQAPTPPPPTPPQQLPSYQQEVKLPDGQRLAYRMDYTLKETGNTYIAAVTSHTAYWSNMDVGYFLICKLYPDIEKHRVTKDKDQKQQQLLQQQQLQQQQQIVHQQQIPLQQSSTPPAQNQQRSSQMYQPSHPQYQMSPPPSHRSTAGRPPLKSQQSLPHYLNHQPPPSSSATHYGIPQQYHHQQQQQHPYQPTHPYQRQLSPQPHHFQHQPR